MISDYVYAEAVTAKAQGSWSMSAGRHELPRHPGALQLHHIDKSRTTATPYLATIAKVMAARRSPRACRCTRSISVSTVTAWHLDPKQRPLPRNAREISPTDLLQARYEIVPYVDITGMKSDLIAWCGNRSRATAGRLCRTRGLGNAPDDGGRRRRCAPRSNAAF